MPRGLRYKMLRSDVFEEFVLGELSGQPGFVREPATVTRVTSGPGGPVVEGTTRGGGRTGAGRAGSSTRALCPRCLRPGPRCSSTSAAGSCAPPGRASTPAAPT
ncbi:hypothetical protein ACFQVA_02530 [Actinomadura keratinilytica]